MSDGASVNTAAVPSLSMFYPNMVDVVCFSHTLNKAGRRFGFPELDNVAQLCTSFFAHSQKVKLAWKVTTGTSMRSYSPTRWWSKWEMLNQVSIYFDDVWPFLRDQHQRQQGSCWTSLKHPTVHMQSAFSWRPSKSLISASTLCRQLMLLKVTVLLSSPAMGYFNP